MSDEPDIEGETAKKLLIENVMKLNPSVLSEYGFKLVVTLIILGLHLTKSLFTTAGVLIDSSVMLTNQNAE